MELNDFAKNLIGSPLGKVTFTLLKASNGKNCIRFKWQEMNRHDVMIVKDGPKPWYRTPVVLIPIVIIFCILTLAMAVILYKRKKAKKEEKESDSNKDIEKAVAAQKTPPRDESKTVTDKREGSKKEKRLNKV